MGIKTKNCEEFTYLREFPGRTPMMHLPENDASNERVLAAAAFPALGVAFTLTRQYIVPTTLLFSEATSTSVSVLRVVGYNQFGERVTEDITLTGAAGVAEALSVNCYLYVESVTYITLTSGTVGASLTIGQKLNHASLRVSLGLPMKLKTTTDIVAVTLLDAAADIVAPTISLVGYKLEIPSIAGTIGNTVLLHLAKSAWLAY